MNLPVFLAVHLRRNIPSFLFTINKCNIVTYLLKSYTQKLSELSFEPLAPMTSINLLVLKAVQCVLWRRRENKLGSCESLRKEKLKLKWYRYRHYEYHATGSNARRWCMRLKTALHARDLEKLCHNRHTLKTETPLFLSAIFGIKIQPPHQRFPQTIRTTQTVKFISYFAHDSLLTPLRYLLPLMI